MNTRAVFIDRDGTLIEEAGYAADLRAIRLFPYTVDAIRQLNRAGFSVVVITNQAGIARGIVADTFPDVAHAYISSRLEPAGARVDRYYHCPHHPEGSVAGLNIRCGCRKPEPGMWTRAAGDLNLDLSRSYSVGDRWTDLQAGHAAGTRAVLVRTGYGRSQEAFQPPGVSADAIADNLIAATGWILQQG